MSEPLPEENTEDNIVYWPRVKEILEGLMQRWEQRRGRKPLPGIHRFYWDSAQQLANDELCGIRAIEPGIPARETQFIRSLARSVGTWGRMPLRGPFLSEEEIDELVSWIDGGMPEGPPSRTGQTTTETAADS